MATSSASRIRLWKGYHSPELLGFVRDAWRNGDTLILCPPLLSDLSFIPLLPAGPIELVGAGWREGEAGFLDFSNQRGITYQNRVFPHTNLFLPPYGKSSLVKWMLEAVVKWF